MELLVADDDLDHAIQLLASIPQLRAVLIRRNPIEVCPVTTHASTDQMVSSSSRISRGQQGAEEVLGAAHVWTQPQYFSRKGCVLSSPLRNLQNPTNSDPTQTRVQTQLTPMGYI